MPRPRLPAILLERPFTLAEAAAQGFTRDNLRGRPWYRLSHGIYCHASLARTPRLLLAAIAKHRLPPSAAFSGTTSSYLHDLDPVFPARIEVTIPREALINVRPGLIVHRSPLPDEDVVLRDGLRTTALPRTLADLARALPLTEAVTYADLALHQRKTKIEDLTARAAAMVRRPGVKRLRQVVDLADARSESPGETRLRLLLINAGLPRPDLQVELRDQDDHLLARADLYYPSAKLVVEFDGSNHRDRLIEDNRRQNRLVQAGYKVLRFTTQDLRDNPAGAADQVRRALSENTNL